VAQSDMETDFNNAAEREAYERNRSRVQALQSEQAQEAEPAAPSSGEEGSKALPGRNEILTAGRLKMGVGENYRKGAMFEQYAPLEDKMFAEGLREHGLTLQDYQNAAAERRKIATGGEKAASNAFSVASGADQFMQGAARDIGNAVLDPVGTAKQVPGGLIDAWNEINRFGASLDVLAADTIGFWPALQISDEEGDLSLAIRNASDPDVRESLKGEDNSLIVNNPIEHDDTLTGNLIRGISQFAAPFGAANKALKGVNVLSKPGAWRELSRFALAGVMTDFAAFDPEMERLTDMADEAGFPVIDYLKSDEDDSEWESRWKNSVEGGIIGGLADVIFQGFRAYKGTQRVREGLEQRLKERDRAEEAAAEEIHRDLWDQGNPNGEALQIVEPPRAETSRERVDRRAAQPEKSPVINGERLLEEDFFDLPPASPKKVEGGQFSFGDAVQNRARFVESETVARATDFGEMKGFSTRAGDVGIEFNRGPESAVIDWDWLDNMAAETPFRAKKLNLQDANEVFSKIGAVVEADAKATRTPAYVFTPATIGLDRVYQRLAPKLADRMGYDYQLTEGGFMLTHPGVADAFKARGSAAISEGINPEDIAARRQIREKARAFISEQTGYEPRTGQATSQQAVQSIQRELESKAPQFAFDEAGGMFTGAAARERLDALRDAGRKAFGDSYEALEADGRVSFAREAGDMDPNWRAFSSGAQAVTTPDGGVVIFTRNTTPDQMEGILLHEVGVHSGMEHMVGARGFDSLLKRIDDLVDAGDGAALRARERAANAPSSQGASPKVISHETLAYMVQYAPNQAVVKDLVSNVKAWVAKEFPGAIKRLGLKEPDFRQLAVMSLRREAIISGQVVAMFGRLGEIAELGHETPKAKPMFNLSQPLELSDRLALGNAMPVRQAIDLDAKPEDLSTQIIEMRDDLLGPGFTERLFEADEAFDPFLWRDTVEAIARGDMRPDVLNQFKQTVDTIKPETSSVTGKATSMFAMKEAPGRLDDRLNATVLDDIKTGRRGLSLEESEALIGSAERWAAALRRQQPSRSQEIGDLLAELKTRNDPEDMRYLVELMEGAKAVVAEPPSLMTFLRKAGGIKDEGGELAARDLSRVKFTNNKSGLTMDEALERAWEAGYIGKPIEGDSLGVGARPADETRPTFNDLMDAIDKEVAGEKVYSLQDFDWVQEAAARQDMRAELERLGIDPGQPRAQIISEFERIAAWQEGDPLTLRDLQDLDRIEANANAKPGVGLPERGLLGGNDIRINFNALNTADDIRSVIGQLADAFAGEIRGARGAPRTNADVIKDSKRLSAWQALNERRSGTALTDAEVPAAQALYIASAENVKATLELAMKQGTDTAHYAARRALVMHRAIQAEIAGAKADASRALRAWSIAQTATSQSRRELNDVLEQYGGRLDPEESARLRTMVEADPEAFDKASRRMGRKASDVGGVVLRFAWLSGPQTHVMNMAGNTLTMVYDIGTRFGAGLKGKILGDAALEHQISIALKEYSGLMAGIRGQFRAFAKKADYGRMGRRLQEAQTAMRGGEFKQGLRTGASALALDNPVSASFRGRFDDRGVSGQAKYNAIGNERAISAEAFGMKQGSLAAKMVNGTGALLSAPVEFLGFADDFFKGVNELATRYRMAQEIVLEEARIGGLARGDMQARFAEIVDNPPEEVLQEARRTAQRRTFTEPIGEGTRMMLKGRNWLNGMGFPLGHLLLPFVVTPSNILKFAFQNGPTGVMFKEVRDELAAGGVRAANAQARIAAGTGLLMIGMDMVANGDMTGRAPQDAGERELWQRQGLQEYSVKVGDKWVSYRRLEPVSTMMAIGADLQTILLNSSIDDGADEDIGELVGPVLGAAINVVTSKTYLTSMTEFIKFTEDGERYGASFIDRLGASIGAPALAAQTEKVQDPVIREASGLVDKWMARMPGLSKDLPAARDLWGRERHVSSGLGQWYDALSPFTVRTQDAEPIDEELQRIGFYPTRPGKSVSVVSPFGVKVSVNLRNRPDIWTRYIELAGNELKIFDGLGTKDYLNAVIAGTHPDSAEYQLLPDSATEPVSKETFIQKRIDQARRVARFTLQQEFGSDLEAMARASIEAQRASEGARELLQAN